MTGTRVVIEDEVYHSSNFDDDGRAKRTGTVWTASAHIITAVIGSGVLSLAWAIAQLGWIAGPLALLAFSVITWFTSNLLADCYRSSNNTRNHTYKQVVKSYLGGKQFLLCGIAQYSNLVGVTVGYSITTSISMVAIKRSNCFHEHGHQNGCHMSNNPFILMFGGIQIILSQIPNFHKLSILSVIAAVMSFAYSSIGLGMSIAKITGGGHVETSLTGLPISKDLTSNEKAWNIFSALGNIAFSYGFSLVLIAIQDTIKSGVPENQVMRKASLIGISVSTAFYMACGLLGYAAFGNNAPGNFLTGFGFYEPFWLVDIANLCIVIHLIGAYQVFAQPLFGFVETWSSKKWQETGFTLGSHKICEYNLKWFRLVWRTCYVMFTTLLAMMFPFFNDVLGLIGSFSFWPLTIYFPVEMYIAKSKIPKYSFTWIWMQTLSGICLIISLLSAAASIRGLVKSLQTTKLFHSVSRVSYHA